MRQEMYAYDLRNPAVSRIHLLKRMTLELREIQALRMISILTELISFEIQDVAHIMYTEGCSLALGGSLFSTAGLTVGSIGATGVSGPFLITSADMRSFSGSAAIVNLDCWEPKNEWMSNGRDRGLLPARNRLVM